MAEHQPVGLSDEVLGSLTELMSAEARRLGMDRLPELA